MSPSVLARVTSLAPSKIASQAKDCPPFTTLPAILPSYRRHKVRHADYPAIVPAPPATNRQGKRNTAEVRGAYVAGLTAEDFKRLDIFEGSEYERRLVRVRVLPQGAHQGPTDVPAVDKQEARHDEEEEDGESGEELETQTYVWVESRERLEDSEWDFEHFVRERLWLWAGSGSGDGSFGEVERAMAEDEGGDGWARDTTGGRSVLHGQFEGRVNGGR